MKHSTAVEQRLAADDEVPTVLAWRGRGAIATTGVTAQTAA
jgi:hypothetical protein